METVLGKSSAYDLFEYRGHTFKAMGNGLLLLYDHKRRLPDGTYELGAEGIPADCWYINSGTDATLPELADKFYKELGAPETFVKDLPESDAPSWTCFCEGKS